MAELPVPSVCQIVHYVSYGTPDGEYPRACRAAIITEVVPVARGWDREPGISLCVLNPTGMFFNRNVPYYEGELLKPGEDRANLCGGRDYAGGTWHRSRSGLHDGG